MNKVKRTEIFTRLRAENPNPTTELKFSSAFELLVAVTLSAQSTDVGVNKATAKLFPVANTPKQIYALGVEGLKTYIKTIGLFNNKAKNIIAACKSCNGSKNDRLPHEKYLEDIIDRNKNLNNLPMGYSEEFMRNMHENCKLDYHGKDKKLWEL